MKNNSSEEPDSMLIWRAQDVIMNQFGCTPEQAAALIELRATLDASDLVSAARRIVE